MPDTNPPKNLNEQFITEPAAVGLPWRLLIFSIVLFGLSLLVYFGFRFGYESYLDSRASDLDNQLGQLSSSVSQEDQQRFIGFYSQIANLKTILGQHVSSANVFQFLEKNTLPQVSYSGAKFKAASANLELVGRTPSLQILAQQLSQMEQSPQIVSATLKSTSFNQSGSVDFTMVLVFQPDFLSKPVQ
jgi:hypothetical protein